MHGALLLTAVQIIESKNEWERERSKISASEVGSMMGGTLGILVMENRHWWGMLDIVWLKLSQ